MHYLTHLVFKNNFTKDKVKFLKRLNTEIFDSAIPPPHIYPREMKTYVHKRTSIKKKNPEVNQLMNG